MTSTIRKAARVALMMVAGLLGVAGLAVAGPALAPVIGAGLNGWHAALAGGALVGAALLGMAQALGEGPSATGGTLGAAGAAQGLFGASVLQPAQPTQAAAGFALGQSAVVVYASTLSPALIAANTTAEQALTVTGLAAGSVVFVTKPTTQAGLGIVGARVTAADSLGLTFLNTSAGNITPTATEQYRIVEIRGPLVQSVALTFGAVDVPAAGTLEFRFTITPAAGTQGIKSAQVAATPVSPTVAAPSTVNPATAPSSVALTPGALTQAPVLRGLPHTVIVNKPTAQAGLGMCGVRVVGNNQIGINYCNPTAAGINPTDETYLFVSLNGLSLRDTIVAYIVDVATLAATATITVATQTRTVHGVAATDRVVGVSKPTAQAGLGVAGARVTAANTIGIDFVNPTAGGLTSTADEHWTVWIDKSQSDPGPVLQQFSVVIQPASVATDTVAEQTFTVTGLLAGCAVVVNVAAGAGFGTVLGGQLPQGLGVVNARVSAADTLALALLNLTAAAVTPPQLMVTVLQAPLDRSGHVAGVDGSAVVWPYDRQAEQMAALLDSLRDAGIALGLIAGS